MTTKSILLKQHEALVIYWAKLSRDGKAYVCNKVQFVGSYISNVVNTQSEAALEKYRPDLIYDLFTFAKERYEFEVAELDAKINKLELVND